MTIDTLEPIVAYYTQLGMRPTMLHSKQILVECTLDQMVEHFQALYRFAPTSKSMEIFEPSSTGLHVEINIHAIVRLAVHIVPTGSKHCTVRFNNHDQALRFYNLPTSIEPNNINQLYIKTMVDV